jgi:hypothetical protein
VHERIQTDQIRRLEAGAGGAGHRLAGDDVRGFDADTRLPHTLFQ